MEIAAAFDMIAEEKLDSLSKMGLNLRIADVGRADEPLAAMAEDELKLVKVGAWRTLLYWG